MNYEKIATECLAHIAKHTKETLQPNAEHWQNLVQKAANTLSDEQLQSAQVSDYIVDKLASELSNLDSEIYKGLRLEHVFYKEAIYTTEQAYGAIAADHKLLSQSGDESIDVIESLGAMQSQMDFLDTQSNNKFYLIDTDAVWTEEGVYQMSYHKEITKEAVLAKVVENIDLLMSKEHYINW